MVIVPVEAPEVVTVLPESVIVKDELALVGEMVSDGNPSILPEPVVNTTFPLPATERKTEDVVVIGSVMVPKAPLTDALVVNGSVIVIVWVPVPPPEVRDAVGLEHCAARSSLAPNGIIFNTLIKFELAYATLPTATNPIINNRTLLFICK